MTDFSERVDDVKAWAHGRITACRAQEVKFGNAWQMREKHSLGPPQALVEAWTERRALEAMLEMLSPGWLARVDKLIECGGGIEPRSNVQCTTSPKAER